MPNEKLNALPTTQADEGAMTMARNDCRSKHFETVHEVLLRKALQLRICDSEDRVGNAMAEGQVKELALQGQGQTGQLSINGAQEVLQDIGVQGWRSKDFTCNSVSSATMRACKLCRTPTQHGEGHITLSSRRCCNKSWLSCVLVSSNINHTLQHELEGIFEGLLVNAPNLSVGHELWELHNAMELYVGD